MPSVTRCPFQFLPSYCCHPNACQMWDLNQQLQILSHITFTWLRFFPHYFFAASSIWNEVAGGFLFPSANHSQKIMPYAFQYLWPNVWHLGNTTGVTFALTTRKSKVKGSLRAPNSGPVPVVRLEPAFWRITFISALDISAFSGPSASLLVSRATLAPAFSDQGCQPKTELHKMFQEVLPHPFLCLYSSHY